MELWQIRARKSTKKNSEYYDSEYKEAYRRGFTKGDFKFGQLQSTGKKGFAMTRLL